MNRRAFVWRSGWGLLTLAVPGWVHGVASSAAAEPPALDLGPYLGKGTPGTRKAPPLFRSANYAQHVSRSGPAAEYNLGGIDYAPVTFFGPTEICPVAAGAVIGVRDTDQYAGIVLDIAHGLGWISEYGHLQARYVGFPGRVWRQDILAIMGKAGQGANRSGVMVEHLHLTVRGPVYSSLYKGIAVQERPKVAPRWRYVLDPEEFSLDGTHQPLPYSRLADEALDDAFLAKHAAAASWCDTLLDRLADAEAAKAKTRERWETQSAFDAKVDERMWFLWQRLEAGPHPWSPAEVLDHKATLLDFMTTVPRFTAPIVESDRREEYRRFRSTPLKIYGQP